MHYHLNEGDGADSYMLEVVRVLSPRLFRIDFFLRGLVVPVESISCGIYKLDVVIELCRKQSAIRPLFWFTQSLRGSKAILQATA